ncbi:MAG: hypothetical protein WC765_02250 [Phycisphaerae bacterium]|jgi:hypothetical protein|nr:hypothetical protein [Phycisphaerales bacterium]HBR19718.1 hypothetical protein [Phycisphaerales bacterium]
MAIVAILTGMLNTSKHKALGMMTGVFSVPMSLGGLSNCEAQLFMAPTGMTSKAADLNCDGTVNMQDRAVIASHWM